MFWKRKDRKNPYQISVGHEDARASYRYQFMGDEALDLTFKGQEVRVIDISAGGLAFEGEGFSRYDAEEVTLDLSLPDRPAQPPFCVQVRILHLGPGRICHCIFENCALDQYEAVHRYVLEMQKRALNKRPRP